MIAEMCRKAQANAFTRKNYDAAQNRRLLEKQVSTDVMENATFNTNTDFNVICSVLIMKTITIC